MKFACSSFSWETKDNKHLLGRTYDQFGNLDGNKIVVIPKDYIINLDNCIDNKNISKTKYTCVGMSILGLKTPILVDGINENGLMGALLHYPDFAKYNDKFEDNLININPGFLVTYLLGKCSTVEEVVNQVKKVNLISEPVFGKEIPVHYIFSDRSGETIIIEPDENGLSIHRQTIGVLTNSPSYLWHKQNITNYIGLTNEASIPQNIVNFQAFESGITGLRLPGDYSSVSRFVRVTLLKEFTVKAKNEIDGITKMFHNFSSVDIPEGVKVVKIPEGDYKGNYYEKTLCMSAMCSESLTYYCCFSTNRRISSINLNLEKLNEDIKLFDLPQEQDISYLN
ncbi:linear amide C-N hydrolase [Faecalimicrobium sp. JNUCC 81]